MDISDSSGQVTATITAHGLPLWRSLSPREMCRNLWQHRQLLWQLTVREVTGRYKGSVLGLVWSAITPLLMLAVYTFVFSVIFRARWGGVQSESRLTFALTLFCGLILFNLFSECLNRAPTLIVQNSNYVKRVVFPLEILPLSVLGGALFFAAVSMLILLISVGVAMQTVSLALPLFPLVLLPLLLLTVGLSWFVASLGVYLRDVGQLIGVVLQILFFMTPIFYPIEMVPEKLRVILRINPLAVVIESARKTLMRGEAPDWCALGCVTLLSAMAAQLGYAWFMKTKRGFADVL